ncbi:MAG: hypothetical protein EXQ87_06670 [Alphaproteobacteria bacterium]|nr:hypothetical protein [Alphaproteobacteria bacterium]
MHDIATLDKRGIPGLAVATVEFEPAARAQAKSLGFDPAIVYVPHPIQNRTAGELAAIADNAIERIIEACTRSA